MKKIRINLLLWIPIIILVLAFSDVFERSSGEYKSIIFSDFLSKIQNKEIKSIDIKGTNIYGELKNGEKFTTYASYMLRYDDFLKGLRESGAEIKISQLSNKKSMILDFLVSWLPILFLFGFYFSRLLSVSGNENPFSFSRSKAKLLQVKGKVTFEDVAGIDEAKSELREIVDFLKDPDKYTDIGAKIPRGCLLIGSPGTGKTLLAKAIAGEANVPFYFISGSDFVEMFVGVGASRVRDMFTEAKKNAPCLVFIDEIDAVGRHRGIGVGGGNDEREQTLNQLLVEMDGFEGNEGVIVIAATNREDVLDKALLRPGRFDRQITVQLPDVRGREEILKVHARKVKMAPNIDLKSVAKATPNFSGAELANIINEAGLLAARNNKKVITNDEIEEAKERMVMGVRNQSRVKKEEEMKLIAYHEAGHALVALNCKNADPIYKATIISRGNAGGYVAQLPENDKHYTSITRASIIDDITISMGGRAAEEIAFGKDKITAGALSDLKVATRYAKNMVVSWGMNDKVGPIYCADKLKSEEGYGFEAGSDETLKLIDGEIKRIIEEAKDRAISIIIENKSKLELIAQALIKYETLTGEEIKKIINNEEIRIEEKIENDVENAKSSNSLFAKILGDKQDGKN
ncbi:MAG: ATP-dependent zinc metalloprotease FtsH [Rickettsiales bacterium]|nr:ATP-dependent zinc metalloprotease FtsH [Rickettsiales bacterium]